MTLKDGSARDAQVAPGALDPRRPSEPARQPTAASRGHHVVMLGIGLAAVAGLPRDRRFQQHVIMVAIVLAAVVGLSRDGSVSSLARLSAWDARRNLRIGKADKPSG